MGLLQGGHRTVWGAMGRDSSRVCSSTSLPSQNASLSFFFFFFFYSYVHTMFGSFLLASPTEFLTHLNSMGHSLWVKLFPFIPPLLPAFTLATEVWNLNFPIKRPFKLGVAVCTYSSIPEFRPDRAAWHRFCLTPKQKCSITIFESWAVFISQWLRNKQIKQWIYFYPLWCWGSNPGPCTW
jgi:hypothetical protein